MVSSTRGPMGLEKPSLWTRFIDYDGASYVNHRLNQKDIVIASLTNTGRAWPKADVAAKREKYSGPCVLATVCLPTPGCFDWQPPCALLRARAPAKAMQPVGDAHDAGL